MLRRIFDTHGCDKGSDGHGYDRCYQNEFIPLRFKPINILEIGIYEGKSIKAWVHYFPNATVHCIDTFERIDASEIGILDHKRVRWMQQDSTTEDCIDNIKKEWGEDIQFDIIIDDGAHWLWAIKATFENFFPLLKPDGAYYIEDVHNMDLPEVQENLANNPRMKQEHNIRRYNVDDWKKLLYTVEQYNVEHFNYIKSAGGKPDSYILKITHDHV